MFILYGKSTRNGKSTYVKALLKFFGDYGDTLPPESIAKNRNKGVGPTPDIAKLKGVRFVNLAEAANDLKLDVALIKSLTGMDDITARKLYHDYENFVNKAVFFMHLNRLPIVDDPTLFISKRAIVIPFDVHFTKKRIDPQMYEKLTTPHALSGLLNAVIKVREEYEGISIKEQLPEKVKKATREFEYKCDPIAHFAKGCLSKDADARTPMKDVYKRFVEFANEQGIELVAPRSLTLELKEKGYRIKRTGKDGNRVIGYSLK